MALARVHRLSRGRIRYDTQVDDASCRDGPGYPEIFLLAVNVNVVRRNEGARIESHLLEVGQKPATIPQRRHGDVTKSRPLIGSTMQALWVTHSSGWDYSKLW